MTTKRYKPSEKYIKALQKTPRRMLIIMTIIMVPFTYEAFSSSGMASLVGLIPVFLIFCGVTYYQNRRIRKELADALLSAYVLTDEGVFLESPTTNQMVPYKDICGVKIKRSVFNKKIVQVLLRDRSRGFWNPLTSMETPELFVINLRNRMGQEDCTWSE